MHKRLLVAGCVMTAAVLLLPSGVAAASPTTAHVAALSAKGSSDNPTVQHKIDEAIAKAKAKGATNIRVTTVPFTLAKSNSSQKMAPNAFPSGCSLSVLLYDYNGGRDVESNNLTVCLNPTQEIQMYSGIARWDLIFWDTVKDDEDGNFGDYDLSLVYDYDCSGQGSNDFQTATNGYVEINGQGYQASAYDEDDNVACP